MTGSSLPPVAIFFTWTIVLAVLITVVVIYRWRKPARHSRFQLKLTLALILFVLVPAVPLVYIAGTAVDWLRGLVVTLPVDDALERGLDVVRDSLSGEEARLEAWKRELLGERPAPGDPRNISPPDFTMRWFRGETGAWELAELTAGSGGAPDSLLDPPPDPRREQPGILEDVAFTLEEHVLFTHRSVGVYMLLLQPPDSGDIHAAGTWISPRTVEARYTLEEGLDRFRDVTRLGGRGMAEFVWTLASLWMVLLTLGSFLAARLLARGVSGPVVELARGMEAVASGDLSTRVVVNARDEMRVLVDSFNVMTRQIREAREQIVAAEKQAAWRDVARRIAHEIKNPLTPIQIGLHRIKTRLEADGRLAGDAAIRESFQTMNEEVEALRRMAAAFSEFAQLPQPVMTPGDLEGVVRGAVALFQEGPRTVRLAVTVQGQIPTVIMDADLVKRALINLIKNAVESVEEAGGGGVDIRLGRAAGEIVIEVCDSGLGFEPEAAPRLFDPDFTTKTRGMGLGLSMVARIVADHSWHLEAASEGPGRGAQMRIHITPAEGQAG